jgi:hypothetical protein
MLLARNVVLIVAAGLAALPLAARELVWMDALTLFATVPVTMLLWMSFWRLVAPARRLGGA